MMRRSWSSSRNWPRSPIENARLYQQLRDTDRRKDEFLATLAHELRNPLAPIRNALQVIRLAGDDADGRSSGPRR